MKQVRITHFLGVQPVHSLLALMVLLHVACTLFLSPHGFEGMDDALYTLMVRDLVNDGSLFFSNGFETYKSDMLQYATFIRANDAGQLSVQYPPFMAVMAAPFYALAGHYGLVAFSALMFIICCWLLMQVALQLISSRAFAALAVWLFAMGSYAWPFSQSYSSHIPALCLMLASMLGVLRVVNDVPSRLRASTQLFASGILLGLAVMTRLDAIFILPALLFPFAFSLPVRLRHMAQFLLGLLLVLVILAWINLFKFNLFNPFTYGRNLNADSRASAEMFIGYALLGGMLGIAVWLSWLRYATLESAVIKKRFGLSLAILSAVAVGVFITLFQQPLLGMWQNLWWVVGDLRAPANPSEYFGHANTLLSLSSGNMHARALLQSVPYLPLIIYSGTQLLRRNRHRQHVLSVLILACISICFIFGTAAMTAAVWRSNLRYLLPVLAFGAIISAHAIIRLSSNLSERAMLLCLGSGWFMAALLCTAVLQWPLLKLDEAWFLQSFPLYGAALLTLLLALRWLKKLRQFPAYSALIIMVCGFLAGYAGASAFAYDYKLNYKRQQLSLRRITAFEGLIKPHSLLVVRNSDTDIHPFLLLEDVQIAKIVRRASMPYAVDGELVRDNKEDTADLPAIVQAALAEGRNVYLMMSRQAAMRLPLKQYKYHILAKDLGGLWPFYLIELKTTGATPRATP